jgi:hypothetical protein
MRRLWFVPIAFAAVLAVPGVVLAGGSDSGFNGVVRSIECRYHVRATRIPFLGLASFIAGRATHGGVSHLHVAEFESFTERLDGDELNAMVEEKLGTGWERIIRETSRQGAEQTLIFIHPEGQRMGLFVLDADGSEVNVVQVSVDPDHLDDDIGHYRHHHEPDAGADADSGASDED